MNVMRPTEPLTRPERGPSLPATALSLIHTGQVTTRAELTAALGVTRATAGAVLTELRALGLVEVDPAPAAGTGTLGRPSHRIGVAPDGPVAVAAQLQPDGFQAALVGLGGALAAVTSGTLDNPDDTERAVETVMTAAASLARESRRPCIGIGLAVPSAVAERDGTAVSPLYVAWPPGTPLRDILREQAIRVGLKVPNHAVGNDINLAALAEHRHGAGRGASYLLVLASGHRGTGGAFVLGGTLYGGSSGLAMEAGHITVSPGGRPCRCGNTGCLDVETDPIRFLEAVGRSPSSAEPPRSEPPPAEPALDRAVAVLRREYATDPRVRQVAREFTEYLGTALAGLINVLNPDRVLLGGLHAALLEILPDELRQTVARRSPWGRGTSVPLLPCQLADAALIGAAELAWQPVLTAPAAPGTPTKAVDEPSTTRDPCRLRTPRRPARVFLPELADRSAVPTSLSSRQPCEPRCRSSPRPSACFLAGLPRPCNEGGITSARRGSRGTGPGGLAV
jgi:predicted NBD/HSP70 family sugar kinase